MNTQKFISPPPLMQVSGRFLNLMIQSLDSTPSIQRFFVSLMEKNSLKDVQLYSWVEYKSFLFTLDEISSSLHLTSLGELFGKKLPFALTNFKAAIAAYHQFYKTTHRISFFEGDDIGFYKLFLLVSKKLL